MTLEDHLGDIIRKAAVCRRLAEAAGQSGFASAKRNSPRSKTPAKQPASQNFAPLAALLGLHPAKLESIANGWLPSEKDLTLWARTPSHHPTARA